MRAIRRFRQERDSDAVGIVDEHFHRYKNRFPFFGFIDINIGDSSFVMFSANDDLVAMSYFWFGPDGYERKSTSLWLEAARQASTVFDIGAYTGVYSLASAAANPTSKIVAFEPSRRTLGRFLVNLFANEFDQRIKIVNSAIADHFDDMKLLQYRNQNILDTGASLVDKGIDITDATETVSTSTIDKYCEINHLKPDLVKIDVEGVEEKVLRGMQETLSQFRPQILIEITPETAPKVKEILDFHGYQAVLIANELGYAAEFRGSANKVCNVLARS